MIGIIGAMEEEIAILLNHLDERYDSPDRIGMYTFHSGKLSGLEVVICNCFPGKVNAAIATTIMVNEYDAKFIINIGIVGTQYADEFPIGSIVLGGSVKQYDVDTTAVGDPKNFISGCNKSIFYPEPNIVATLRQKYGLKRVSVSTGDTFIDSDEIKDIIGADVFDMESGAIAQVCYCLGYIPFLIIKCISDSGNSEEYDRNKISCCEKVQEFLIKVLESLYLYK